MPFFVANILVVVAWLQLPSSLSAVAEEKYCSYQNNVGRFNTAADVVDIDVDALANGTASAGEESPSSPGGNAPANVSSDSVSLVKKRRKQDEPSLELGEVLSDNVTMKCEKPGMSLLLLLSFLFLECFFSAATNTIDNSSTPHPFRSRLFHMVAT